MNGNWEVLYEEANADGKDRGIINGFSMMGSFNGKEDQDIQPSDHMMTTKYCFRSDLTQMMA